MSHKVQLYQKHKHEGLEVITVNMEGEETQEKSLAILKRLNIGVTNWLIAEGSSEEALAALEAEGALPTVNFYDRKGRKRHQLVGINDAEIDDWVGRLLSE